VSAFINIAALYRGKNRAVRFGAMQTIAESTAGLTRPFETREMRRGIQGIQIHSNKVLKARRIDQCATAG